METKDTSYERIFLYIYIPRCTEMSLASVRFRIAEMTI